MIKNKKNSYLVINPNSFYYDSLTDFLPICLDDVEHKDSNVPRANREIKAKIPTSVYRVQLSKKVNFNYLTNNINYFKELGITDLYLSPIFQSNSEHGYDITDFSRINPMFGSYDDIKTLSFKAKKHGISLILDFVPNHMGIINNSWWLDVLENGVFSKYANYFDIDFSPLKKELKNKVLLPVLGNYYGKEIKNKKIKIHFNKDNASFYVNYYDSFYPLSPQTYSTILEHRKKQLISRARRENIDEFNSITRQFKNLKSLNSQGLIKEREIEKNIACNRLKSLILKSKIIEDFICENVLLISSKPALLHNLLEKQNFRLAFWQVASDEINYRRFFDINSLAGINIEQKEVFEAAHKLLFQLISDDIISGIRLDHTDGLCKPGEYFFQLQTQIAKLKNAKVPLKSKSLLASNNLPFYVVCEKILSSFEKLPKNWAVQGTSGYDFLNCVQGLFVNQDNISKLKTIYENFAGQKDIESLVVKSKKDIMKNSLAGELNVLINILSQIAESSVETRDFTVNNLRSALVEVIANFPVYRTYIVDEAILKKYKEYISWAIKQAKKNYSSQEVSILEFIKNVLFLNYKEENALKLSKRFIYKFQQYTSPLMAKGVEDTYFYRYNLLLSLNEVGANHTKSSVSILEFHKENLKRLKYAPYSMITTSTHDTKRSEDARNKLAVLSDLPDKWGCFVESWVKYSKYFEGFSITSDDFYHFIQTVIAIFPVEKPNLGGLQTRLKIYMQKAVKEAKTNTSWLNQDFEYEKNLDKFIDKFISHYNKTTYWKILNEIIYETNLRGMINSLNTLGIKFTSTGVPDIYNGNENFIYQLVDPDNRVDLDFLTRDEKFILTKFLLNFRLKHKELFLNGEYEPIEINDNILCYKRTLGSAVLLCIFVINSSALWELDSIKNNVFNIDDEVFKGLIPQKSFSVIQNRYINCKELFGRFPLEILYWQHV